MAKRRLIFAAVLLITITAGLASRRFGESLPGIVASYAGDTLWAVAAYFAIGFVMPRWPSRKIAIAALLTSIGVELSQLYHAPWIDGIRATRIGGLLLGFGFMWSDLICYAVGAAAACVIDRCIQKCGI